MANAKSSAKQIRGTKKDAEKLLTAWLRDMDKGVFIEPSRQTLNEHLDSFLEIIKPRVAEQTFNSYEMMLRVHIRPVIGEMKLPDIKNSQTVQKVYAKMQEKGLSARTVRYAHSVFSMALNKAVELGYIVSNPCKFVTVTPKQKRNQSLLPEQAKNFLECAKDNKHGLIFEIALSSGMRPEEYLSLLARYFL